MSSIYIVYDIYSKCCEPCLSCHINILIENIIQVFVYVTGQIFIQVIFFNLGQLLST